jgi:hypothetical protein
MKLGKDVVYIISIPVMRRRNNVSVELFKGTLCLRNKYGPLR